MTLQINDYRMKGERLVHITCVIAGGDCQAQYISVSTQDGIKAVAGEVDWHKPSELSAVVDPMLIAAAKSFDANLAYERLDKSLDEAWAEVLRWTGVLECMHEAELAGAAA